MRTLSLLIALVAILSASKVEAGDFYQWTTEDGTVSFAENAKDIPKRYQATAQERTFAEVAAKVHETPILVTPKVHFPSPAAPEVVNPNRLDDCTGPVTVTTERRQVGDYNRTFYVMKDECGFVVYDSPVPIELRANR